MKPTNVYLISGLGADQRLFQKLVFPDACRPIPIDWIPPVDGESMGAYALRLSQVIDRSQPFYLIGLSFGGMVACEMARFLNPVGTIIISSASTAREIPWYYRLAGKLRLPRLLPMAALKWVTPFTYWFFGAATAEEKKLLKQVIRDTDKQFVRWAILALTCWKNQDRPQNIFHIHGACDKILPAACVKADQLIAGGGHLMVFSQAAALSDILAAKLGSPQDRPRTSALL